MSNKPRSAIKLWFLPPKKVLISLLKGTGQFAEEFPTFTLSYVGIPVDSTPDDGILADIQAFQINFDPQDKYEAELEIVAYTQPKEELLDFADSYGLKCIVNTPQTNKIFQKINAIGKYVVIINTEFYCYRALVDDESGEVLEATVDYRMIN